jgi:hypothetical protein
MNRAIDSISGRLNEPLTLTEENAWRKTRRHNWDRTNNVNGYYMTYFWNNMVSNREIEITKEEFENQSQPNL